MNTDNIKVYISCHKECYTPKHDFMYPIQVGAEKAAKRFEGMLHDDEGENISSKNPMYCELTAQYWAWKNDDADYYGFFHYRRYMSFSEKQFPHNLFEDVEMNYLDDRVLDTLNLSKERMQSFISQYDVIATTPVVLKKLNRTLKSNYYQYEITPYRYAEDLEVMLDIIKEKYPEYYDTAYYYLHKSPIGYYCNMFIMRKEIFKEYSEWLFTILEEHEKRRDYSNYDIDGYRVSGYLGERLFGIYYMYLKQQGKYKCCELQRTLFENVDKHEQYKPAFAENNVAIAFAANDYFVPYMATMLQSIIENSSSEKNYDIFILTQDISVENRNCLRQMIEERANFSIRYINPAYLIDGYEFFMRGHFSLETYYRLVLPELLPDYDKILYMDSDMVVTADVAELYDTDVNGYLLAACRDADTAGLYNGFEPKKKEYTDKVLKLKNPYEYFQAGVLLMNLEEFRKQYDVKEILEFAASEDWQLLDQDILNKLCEDKVKYVDMSWNVMVDYGKIRINQIIRLAPQWLNKLYMEARKAPKIIHYAGPEKPWIYPEMDMGKTFWKYAKNTPYYESMLYRMGCAAANQHGGSTRNKGMIGGGIQCIRDHGIVYTIKYLPKKLGR